MKQKNDNTSKNQDDEINEIKETLEKRLTKRMELVTDEKTNTMIIAKGCILKTNTTHRNDEVYQSIYW